MTRLQDTMKSMATTIEAAYRGGMTESDMPSLYPHLLEDDGTSPGWFSGIVRDIVRDVDAGN